MSIYAFKGDFRAYTISTTISSAGTNITHVMALHCTLTHAPLSILLHGTQQSSDVIASLTRTTCNTAYNVTVFFYTI